MKDDTNTLPEKFNRNEYCEEHGHETLIFLSEEEYDDAIIGVTTNGNVVYHGMKLVELIMNNDPELSWDDAMDHYEYNIVGSLANSNIDNMRPILVNLD